PVLLSPCHALSVSPSFFVYAYRLLSCPHSFPTRRSSDLLGAGVEPRLGVELLERLLLPVLERDQSDEEHHRCGVLPRRVQPDVGDRKSTRLNSSHVSISYAVFSLKKNIPTYNYYGKWRFS